MLCIRYLNTGGIVKILSVDTKPFDNQKPGTGGLRKQTSVFFAPNFSENFIQYIKIRLC